MPKEAQILLFLQSALAVHIEKKYHTVLYHGFVHEENILFRNIRLYLRVAD